MGFLPNHERAPERDLPCKRGFPRFLELLGRDFWKYFKAGFLALLGALPFLIGMSFALQSHVLLFAPAAGVIGGAIAGPGLCGLRIPFSGACGMSRDSGGTSTAGPGSETQRHPCFRELWAADCWRFRGSCCSTPGPWDSARLWAEHWLRGV